VIKRMAVTAVALALGFGGVATVASPASAATCTVSHACDYQNINGVLRRDVCEITVKEFNSPS